MVNVWKTLTRRTPRQAPRPRPVTPPTPEGTIPPTNFYNPIEPATEEIEFTDPTVSLVLEIVGSSVNVGADGISTLVGINTGFKLG